MATESEVIIGAQQFTRRGKLSADQVHEVVLLAWMHWRGSSNQSLEPGVYVWRGFQQHRRNKGRECFGLYRSGGKRKLFRQCAGMDEVPDRFPSTFRIIAGKDALASLEKTFTPFENALVEHIKDGVKGNKALASALGVSESTVNNVKMAILKRYRSLTS